jgi:glycerate-2-kinase
LTPRELLRRLFDAAIAAADPAHCLPPHLPPDDGGRLIVIGAGKAAAAMAQAVERHWSGPLAGLVVTRYGHGVPCQRIEVVEAAHPVPDAAGAAAADSIFGQISGLTVADRVLALFSGGGSALLAAPAAGVTLEVKRALTSALLRSGASIGEINCVRKHLSAIKGGRLAAAAYPASVLTLAISDVPGDDPAVIASGPTVGDPSSCADALRVLDAYAIEVPPAVRQRLVSGELETPKPGDPRLARSEFRLIASPRQMLEAAAAEARRLGIAPLILGDALEGEAPGRRARRGHRPVGRRAAARGGVLLSLSRSTHPRDRSARPHRARAARRAQPRDLRGGAAPYGLYYAPDPSSQIACTIGGNVAENSGGVHCLKYGLTVHNVLRVRGVTIDGEISNSAATALDARATTCSR